jgi:hypothetical protein
MFPRTHRQPKTMVRSDAIRRFRGSLEFEVGSMPLRAHYERSASALAATRSIRYKEHAFASTGMALGLVGIDLKGEVDGEAAWF